MNCSRRSRSEEHTSELQSLRHLVCRLLLGKKQENHHIQQARPLLSALLDGHLHQPVLGRRGRDDPDDPPFGPVPPGRIPFFFKEAPAPAAPPYAPQSPSSV